MTRLVTRLATLRVVVARLAARWIADALIIAGVCACVRAAALVSPALGWAVAGVALVAIGVLLAMQETPRRPS